MMNGNLRYVSMRDDRLIRKELEKVNRSPHLLIGDTAVGPNNVVLPSKYANYGGKILRMDVRPDDVWVVTFPRSGTTWTQEMMWLLCNDLDFETAKTKYLSQRYHQLEEEATLEGKFDSHRVASTDDVERAPSPRFIKTHLPLELLPKQLWTVKPKIIYVCRNPKDVCISRYHFARMMDNYEGTFEEYADLFLQDKLVYCPYWKHVLNFWELSKKQDILFLTYEDMKKDLLLVIRKAADYAGVPICEEKSQRLAQHLNFQSMRKNAAVNLKTDVANINGIFNEREEICFIRKGVAGGWKHFMSPDLAEKFDLWSSANLDRTDFPYY